MTDYAKLARLYAPVFAQKVHEEWPAADQIAPIDLAGSLKTVFDNPEFLANKDPNWVIPNPKVYYSVCETTTHYFLIYAVYHPLDWWKRVKAGYFEDPYNWIRRKLDQHVHDMEGLLMVLSKERQKEGAAPRVDAIITVSHFDFYLYARPQFWDKKHNIWQDVYPDNRRVVNFRESVDGRIEFDTEAKRVKVFVEAKGHGIRGDKKGWNAGKQIWWYNPIGVKTLVDPHNEELLVPTADTVFGKGKPAHVRAYYELDDICAPDGLWDSRLDKDIFMQRDDGQWAFVGKGWLTKSRGQARRLPGAANPPWSWNDNNDPSPMGEIATDPARFIIRYGQGWGPVSTQYIYNPYHNIGVE
ncbi:MAG: hypothetical protein Q9P44_03695 [Anaerolineae bacterium]|nr:hypothetical protein [Anaerolineae bacterium]